MKNICSCFTAFIKVTILCWFVSTSCAFPLESRVQQRWTEICIVQYWFLTANHITWATMRHAIWDAEWIKYLSHFFYIIALFLCPPILYIYLILQRFVFFKKGKFHATKQENVSLAGGREDWLSTQRPSQFLLVDVISCFVSSSPGWLMSSHPDLIS